MKIIINCGANNENRLILSWFYVLAFHSEWNIATPMHLLTAAMIPLDDPTTSCKHLVNFDPVTRNLRGFSVCLCTWSWRKLAYPSSFVVLAFRNVLEDCSVDGRINSADDLFTSDRNFVSFRPVTQLFCVQQVLISIRISLATFARRRHC